ncbi:phage tail tape measure protein [Kitasatospora sp. NPDC051164]|uniref:phage tail tape measure protein n=1 Tax=Kitasatospora sp. NPDC051164 TaxID=3364055 RepID=UPI00379CBA92
MGGLPPVFIEFIGSSAGVKAAVADTKVALAEADAAGAGAFAKTGLLGKAALAGLGIAAFEAGKHAIEAAGDFQAQMTRVRTGAGEAAENMKMVSDGVLAMAGEVGQSTEHLTAGLYQIESAGYHGSAALEVLKNSAMGAKVGAAELSTVADAVTTGLNAYGLSAGHAAEVTNALVATEASGKTNMEALAGSMSKILPTASAAKVGLNEVLAAMATMTAQGTTADVAATYLRQTIGALSNPSGKAAMEMKSLGLSAVEVGQNLGKQGLASTLEMLTDAIEKKMGPAGTVLIDHLRKASANTTDYEKVLANLAPEQQTYIGALATMVGGTKSMMAALQLTGPHMETFKKNIETINEHVKTGGHEIEGWADVQQNFNQKLDSAKAAAGALAIQIGQYLMPYAEKLAAVVADGARWITQHEMAAKVLAGTIAGVLVVAMVALTVAMWNFTAAALANPVVWITVGVLALVAALVYLGMHWRAVWDFIRGAALAVASAVVSAWHWLSDKTDEAWQWVYRHVQEAWHAVAAFFSSAWHSVADPAVEAWHSIRDGAVDAWNATAAFFVAAWHTVVDPIVAAWNWVSDVTSQVWNAISAFFAKWWPLLFVIFFPYIAVFVAIWNHFHEQIIGTAMTVWHAVADFLSMVWNGVAASAKASWAFIQQWIIQPVVETWQWLVGAWNAVAAWLSAVWAAIGADAKGSWEWIHQWIIAPTLAAWNWLVGAWNAVAAWLSSVWQGISNTAAAAWHSVHSAIVSPVEDALNAMKTKASEIASTITGGVSSAWNAAKGKAAEFVNVGIEIVNGIGRGISQGWNWLKNKVKDLANDALNAAKSFLGISSPSRVFAEQVGHWIPHGIAAGVQASAGVALAAVTALSGAAVDAGSLTAAQLQPGVSLPGSMAGAGQIVQHTTHITVQGSVLAERDLRDLVRQQNLQDGARNIGTYQPYAR